MHKHFLVFKIYKEIKHFFYDDDATILECMRRAGIEIGAGCGGVGKCKKCRVYLEDGAFRDLKSGEETRVSVKTAALACQTKLVDYSGTVDVVGYTAPGKWAFVSGFYADACSFVGEIPRSPWVAGLDIGTTSISLMGIYDGDSKFAHTTRNGQASYGDNVMTRIAMATTEEKLATLRSALLKSVCDILNCWQREFPHKDTTPLRVAVAANPTMAFFFHGLSPVKLGHSPFELSTRFFPVIYGKDLELPEFWHGAEILTLPAASAFIGGDAVGGAVFNGVGLDKNSRELYMDFGTNCEVILATRGEIYAASAPAGPAFERSDTAHECPICNIKLSPSGELWGKRHTGSNQECETAPLKDLQGVFLGSAWVDFLAMLANNGMLKPNGLYDAERIKEFNIELKQTPPHRLLITGGNREGISNEVIAELQQAKAAIYTVLKLLFDRAKIDETELDRVIISGGWSISLDVESGKRIGILPKVEKSKFKMVGNAALGAAVRYAADLDFGQKVAEVAAKIVTIHPEEEEKFIAYFMEGLNF